MRAKRTLTALVTGLALTAAAPGMPAMAQTWTLTVTADRQVTTDDLQTNEPNTITAAAAQVQITCATASDCPQVGLRFQKSDGTVVPPTLGRSPANSNNFLIPSGPVKGTTLDLAVTFQNEPIASFPVTAATAAGTTTTPETSQPAANSGEKPTLADMLSTTCNPQVPPEASTLRYDAKKNQGEILVTPAGVVLARAVDTFDENDTLQVIVYGDVQLLPLLKVERTSTFRDVQTVRVVGGGVTVPQSLITRQSGGVCSTWKVPVGDFAPGEGTVQISALQGTEWVPLGSFDFNVDPLYTGMLTLGAAWTSLVDPGYKVASNGTETVVALGEEGDRDLLYTLFYTPFVWGKRDLEKTIPRREWYKHLNPSVGVVPSDLNDNALVGITLDLPAGFAVTFGRHFRRITVLPADTGLAPGSPFSGTADELPTAKSWENDNFFAVTIDLRAIVQLFTAAAGGGGS